jgi:hypothetical protein
MERRVHGRRTAYPASVEAFARIRLARGAQRGDDAIFVVACQGPLTFS